MRALEDNFDSLRKEVQSISSQFYSVQTSITNIEEGGASNAMLEEMFASHSKAFRKDFTALDDKCNLAIDGLNEMKDELDQISTEVNSIK